jgi:uncharacterized Tic20 family protein
MNQMQFRPPTSLQTNAERQMGLFLHLSPLLGMFIPAAGIVVPIILWQTQKDKMPSLDRHGKMVVNWLISSFIYAVISIPLLIVTLLLIGMPVFILLIMFWLAFTIVSIAFPIIGAVKANSGELWEYPLTIKFLK